MINASGSLTITTSSLPNATVNTEYRTNILANMSSVSWGIEGALPPGLDFNTSTGQIAGIPTSSSRRDNNNSGDDESSGSGGCNSLPGTFAAVLAGLFALLRRK